MAENWKSKIITCRGGLVLAQDTLTQGTADELTGTALQLQNLEPALEGGYERVLGYAKYDTSVVPGTGKIFAVTPAFNKVFAVRKIDPGTDHAIYKSSTSGWGTKLNATARNNTVTKARFISYTLSSTVILLTDGANPAWKYDDTTETLINGTGAPTAPKFAAEFKGRLALAPASTPSTVILSAPNQDTVFDPSLGAFEINVGDVITGLYRFRDILYVFCKNSIHRIEGNTSSDLVRVSVTQTVGCIDHDTIQEVGGDLIFLANDGLRSIAGTDKLGDVELALYSDNIQPLVRDYIRQYGEGYWNSVYIRLKNQYRLFLDVSGTSDADSIGILGTYKQNGYEWATLKGIPSSCADSTYDNSTEAVVFGHKSDGFVYKMESGNAFGTNPISWVYWTPNLTFSDNEIRKVFREINIYTQLKGDVDFNIELVLNYDDPSIPQPSAIQFNQAGSVSVFGSAALFGTALFSSVAFPRFRDLLVGSGFTGQFRFVGSSATNSPIRIDSFQIEFAYKGRK